MLTDVIIVFYSFFFFKQKTAYEMRISDWSSDVCSSDLLFAVAVVDEDGDDSHVRHFLRGIDLSGQDHAFRHAMAQFSGKDGIGAHSREQPEQHFGKAEASAAFGHHDVYTN